MVKVINQFISSILLIWMGLLTQLTVTHLGHGHELLPLEANLCIDTCNLESHHKAGNECELFITKRLIANDGPKAIIQIALTEFEKTQKWVAINSLSARLDYFPLPVRGPPFA